jgi:hypothetical protein
LVIPIRLATSGSSVFVRIHCAGTRGRCSLWMAPCWWWPASLQRYGSAARKITRDPKLVSMVNDSVMLARTVLAAIEQDRRSRLGCVLLPFGPTLLHGQTDLPTRRCRKSAFTTIRPAGCRPGYVPAALKGYDGSIQSVSFRFQFRNNRLCVQGGLLYSERARFYRREDEEATRRVRHDPFLILAIHSESYSSLTKRIEPPLPSCCQSRIVFLGFVLINRALAEKQYPREPRHCVAL